MGTYRAPERAINRSSEIIGNEVNKLFQEQNAYFQKQQIANQKVKQRNEVNKLKGRQEWQKKLAKSTPEQGFSKDMMRQLHDWGDEYYSLYGSTDQESLHRLDELLKYPEELAKTQGVIYANKPAYEAALNMMDQNGPKAINYNTSWPDGLNIMSEIHDNNGKNFTIREVRGDNGEPGQLIWDFPDQDGNMRQVNNGELIKYSEGGKLMFDINGNIDDVMLEYVNGVGGEGGWKEIIDYDKGLTKVSKGSTSRTTSKLFEAKNEELKKEAYNADMSSTLNNSDTMNGIWPQLTAWAAKNKPELIYGPDKRSGGDDDLITSTDGRPALWFGGNDNEILKQQQEVAKSIMIERMFDPAYAATYGIKQDVVTKRETGLSSGSDSGGETNKQYNAADAEINRIMNTNWTDAEEVDEVFRNSKYQGKNIAKVKVVNGKLYFGNNEDEEINEGGIDLDNKNELINLFKQVLPTAQHPYIVDIVTEITDKEAKQDADRLETHTGGVDTRDKKTHQDKPSATEVISESNGNIDIDAANKHGKSLDGTTITEEEIQLALIMEQDYSGGDRVMENSQKGVEEFMRWKFLGGEREYDKWLEKARKKRDSENKTNKSDVL